MNKVIAVENKRRCPRCECSLSLDMFYAKRGKAGFSTYCKKCTNIQTTERQRALKSMAIEYNGGSCQSCGYHRTQAALEFHHTNPNEKDFAISNVKHTSFEKIKSELNKCVLLCANCHREAHQGLILQ